MYVCKFILFLFAIKLHIANIFLIISIWIFFALVPSKCFFIIVVVAHEQNLLSITIYFTAPHTRTNALHLPSQFNEGSPASYPLALMYICMYFVFLFGGLCVPLKTRPIAGAMVKQILSVAGNRQQSVHQRAPSCKLRHIYT